MHLSFLLHIHTVPMSSNIRAIHPDQSHRLLQSPHHLRALPLSRKSRQPLPFPLLLIRESLSLHRPLTTFTPTITSGMKRPHHGCTSLRSAAKTSPRSRTGQRVSLLSPRSRTASVICSGLWEPGAAPHGPSTRSSSTGAAKAWSQPQRQSGRSCGAVQP